MSRNCSGRNCWKHSYSTQLRPADGGIVLWNNWSLFTLPKSVWDWSMHGEMEGPNKPQFVWLNWHGVEIGNIQTNIFLCYSVDPFSFLVIFFCNSYLKIIRKLPPQYCLQEKMERDYSLWIKIINFIGIFIQGRKQRNNRRLMVT